MAALATTLDSELIPALTLNLESEEVTILATALDVISLPDPLNLERKEVATLATVTTQEVISLPDTLNLKGETVDGSDSDAATCTTSNHCLHLMEPTTNTG